MVLSINDVLKTGYQKTMGTKVVSRSLQCDTLNEEERDWVQVTSKKKSKGKEVRSEDASSSNTQPSCSPRAAGD